MSSSAFGCFTPSMFGTSWLIAFIVWCDLWQWKAQSPSTFATNSTVRVDPTGTFTVVSGRRADFGTGPPSVLTSSNV